MEKTNQSTLLYKVFSLILLALSGAFATFSVLDSRDYQKELESRDSLIRTITFKDSAYHEKLQGYTKVINQYVTGCKFIVGDSSYSSEEFVQYFSRTLSQKRDYEYKYAVESIKNIAADSLIRSLYDSLNYYKSVVKSVEKRYGITYNYRANSSGKVIWANLSKTDSALMLLPYYRDRISRDTINNTWRIIRFAKEQ